MKFIVSIHLFLLLFGCGSTPDKPKKDIINTDKTSETTTETPIAIKETPVLPDGAVTANFIEEEIPFYAHVKAVNKAKGETTIDFENEALPAIVIPKTYGATLSTLRFDEFNQDLLLVTTKLKDPQFNKYYLYIFKNKQWQKVVNGFAIHKSHVNDTLIPITIDPDNPRNMFRYYSVFDLDEKSELGYTWRLFSESIPIQNN